MNVDLATAPIRRVNISTYVTGQLDRRPKMGGYESGELLESGDIWTLQQIGRNEVVAELKRFIRLYRSFLDRLVHIDER